MADFTKCNLLGKMGQAVVVMGLSQVYRNVTETPDDIETQLLLADIICKGFEKMGIKDESIEVKTEYDHTGNLFWETWSNKRRGRLGWGKTSKADVLYYLFWRDAIGYRIPDLQTTIFNFEYYRKDYREVKQQKNDQTNDTWGCLVPVETDWLKATRFEFPIARDVVQGRFAA